MREDDRRPAGGDRILHRVGRDVAEINQHADPVHLVDDGDSERAEAAVLGIVGRAVRPFGGLVVGQRHVARAEVVILAQGRERAADLAAALDPQHRRHAPGLVDAHDVVGGARELKVLRISVDHPPCDIDLLDGLADCRVAGHRAVDVDRPELPTDAAPVEPRHVGHQRVRRPLVGAAREPGDAALVILGELFGDIVVAVDQRGRLEDSVDPRLDLWVDRIGGRRGGNEGDCSGEQQHGFERHGRGFRREPRARAIGACPLSSSRQ